MEDSGIGVDLAVTSRYLRTIGSANLGSIEKGREREKKKKKRVVTCKVCRLVVSRSTGGAVWGV